MHKPQHTVIQHEWRNQTKGKIQIAVFHCDATVTMSAEDSASFKC